MYPKEDTLKKDVQNMTPNEILMIDVDWMPKPWWLDWVETRKSILEGLGYQLTKTIRKPSQSGKGLHVWLYIETHKPLTDMEKVKLQYLLGDCIVRSSINYRRVRRGIKVFWNKLFSIKHKLQPLPKRCQKCRIRLAVAELEEKDEKWSG
jgi:hypothetical protein